MLEETYREERERLLARRAEVDGLIQALDLLWNNHWSQQPPEEAPQPGRLRRRRIRTRLNGSLPRVSHAIRDVALAFSPEVSFGVEQVEDGIRERWPSLVVNRTTISGVLMAMAEKDDLRLMRRGKGSRPSSYRVPEPPAQEEDEIEE